MKWVIIVSIMLAMLSASMAYAKRAMPGDASPVTGGSIEYRALHHQTGCVEAWDQTRNPLARRRQIYDVKYTLNLERGVQDVFIKTLALNGGTLIIKNERKSENQLDLEPLNVKVLKGSWVETWK